MTQPYNSQRAPAPAPDPGDVVPAAPALTGWQFIAYTLINKGTQLGILLIASLGTLTSILNREKAKAIEADVAHSREVQQYHEAQLDSIGAKVDETKKETKKVADKVVPKKDDGPKRVGEE